MNFDVCLKGIRPQFKLWLEVMLRFLMLWIRPFSFLRLCPPIWICPPSHDGFIYHVFLWIRPKFYCGIRLFSCGRFYLPC